MQWRQAIVIDFKPDSLTVHPFSCTITVHRTLIRHRIICEL